MPNVYEETLNEIPIEVVKESDDNFKEVLDNIINLHNKMGSAWSMKPSKDEEKRLAFDKENTKSYQLEMNDGSVIHARLLTDSSTKNVYYRSHFSIDSNDNFTSKKDIRLIKNIRNDMEREEKSIDKDKTIEEINK